MLRITYVGHATLLLELDGVRILTDPVLRRHVGHLRRIVPLREPLPAGIRPNAILVSHIHMDHFHVRTLGRFRTDVAVLVPRGAAVWFLRRIGFLDVRAMEEGSSLSIGAVRVHAVRARHPVLRGASRIVGPALGYLVEGSASVYFAGDTDVYPTMSSLRGIDVALLPVAGWGSRLPEGSHMNPLRAAESLKLLQPRVAIPIHWGTFTRRWAPGGDREHQTAAEQFRDYAGQLAPEVEVHVVNPGEDFTLLP